MPEPHIRFGHYEILSTIGTGGMGEVFRARDTRLDRDVAVKVLPSSFVSDPERVARFEREARTLAALNHPHIAAIYGLEESEGVRALVMELVEGATLASLVSRGALPLEEALQIAQQIAEALEAAHDLGIVHRDLKPANVKVRPDGSVKVLDFGLAKPLGTAPASRGQAADLADSPTIASPGVTMRGVILGTAAYMSPEQARGKAVDARTDIWAFGCVLFEMLTGRPAFTGETVTDILTAVVHKDPDWTLLPDTTPPPVRDILEHCLRKDPARRVHHMADVRIALDDARVAATADAPVSLRPKRRGATLWASAAVLAAAAAATAGLAAWMTRAPREPPPVYSFTIDDAGFNTVSTAAISHDGRRLAYASNSFAAPFRLFVRPLDGFDGREITSGNQPGFNPFFSADDRWIAYFSQDVLYKVPVSGGAPERIGEVGHGFAQGAWGPNGTIVVTGNLRFENVERRALATLPASGGALVPLTRPGPNESHLDPELLPDGRTVIFTLTRPDRPSIAVVPLSGGEPRIILDDARTPKYSATGHLVFQRASSGDLLAVPFDADRLETAGEATRLGSVALVIDTASLAVASNGTLIYSAPGDTARQAGFTIVSVDRSGSETTVLDRPGAWASPRVSPDGRLVLYRAIDTPNCDLWTIDLARGTRTRVTFEGDNHDPIWRHDGQATWASQTTGPRGLRMAPADRPTEVTSIAKSVHERRPSSWSRDGKRLAFTEVHPETGDDLWMLSADSGEARPIVATPFNEMDAVFSPDGRWIAYVSNESGRNEIYLRPADGEGGRLQISADGGRGPLWSPDGKELYFADSRQFMAVEVDTKSSPLRASRPRALIRGPYVWEVARNYDVTPDGRRFVFVRRADGGDPSATLRVIVNWPARLP